jgi:phosphatidylglycerol lysyltransferase
VSHESKLAGPGALAMILRRNSLRMTVSLAAGGLMVWLLVGRLSAIEPAAVAQAFAALPAQAWGAALLATAASFWAVGHYDAIIHRHFATGLPEARARLAGICAIAVSQMIGLGVVSGAVLRWRMLPEIGAWQATRLTAAVALSFLGAWAMVTALTLLALPLAPFKAPAALVLGLGLALGLISVAAPRLKWLRLRWPNVFTLCRLLSLCVIDTLAAAIAFYALCPPGLDLAFTALLPAFLLALGAGLVSGSPGGMGAFEMTLLALLPSHGEPELLAAVLGWRIVYFALPAIVGSGIAIRGPSRISPPTAAPDRGLVLQSDVAELQILRQGEHQLIGAPASGLWVAGQTPHCLIGLFAPLCGPGLTAAALRSFRHLAASEGRLCVIYKAAPRLACVSRRAGFKVIALAREALIRPAIYDLASPSRAGLRRKLRQASAAGVTVLCSGLGTGHPPDWPSMDRIAAEWATAHGGERGFSMGRYCRRYLKGQRLYIAYFHGQPIAFATFHDGPGQWTLDLMRHSSACPDGTMHLLIHTAITDARALSIACLSLAAAPECAFDSRKNWPSAVLTHLGADDGTGLMRFKSAFDPRWQRRYLCSPNLACLPLVAFELARSIHRPAPLPGRGTLTALEKAEHDDAAEYAFASAR